MKTNATTLNPDLLRSRGVDWRQASDSSIPHSDELLELYLWDWDRTK